MNDKRKNSQWCYRRGQVLTKARSHPLGMHMLTNHPFDGKHLLLIWVLGFSLSAFFIFIKQTSLFNFPLPFAKLKLTQFYTELGKSQKLLSWCALHWVTLLLCIKEQLQQGLVSARGREKKHEFVQSFSVKWRHHFLEKYHACWQTELHSESET